ncbi:hypothetical protein GUJ93_ZPchr0009g290 [Zizania palustris]|uniref:Uncharacterized protein n=1 Tax=Zizania palustris TaxID=103762 RepID=A0A8J5V9C3_ZIZPA|nr:hypothetical protein GUJ93_ZPchr0009g290 [Zizania palustris]
MRCSCTPTSNHGCLAMHCGLLAPTRPSTRSTAPPLDPRRQRSPRAGPCGASPLLPSLLDLAPRHWGLHLVWARHARRSSAAPPSVSSSPSARSFASSSLSFTVPHHAGHSCCTVLRTTPLTHTTPDSCAHTLSHHRSTHGTPPSPNGHRLHLALRRRPPPWPPRNQLSAKGRHTCEADCSKGLFRKENPIILCC